MKMIKYVSVALLCAVAALASGCTSVRALTATHWHSDDVYYVAYLENKGVGTKAKIKACKVQEGNTLKCVKQKKVNKMLNKK